MSEKELREAGEMEYTDKEAERQAKAEERKLEWARLKENLRDNRDAIIALLKGETPEQPLSDVESVVEDVLTLIGHKRGSGASRKTGKGRTPAIWKQFVALFAEDGEVVVGAEVSELDLFMKLRIGQARAKQACAEAIKKADNPEDAVFITFVEPESESDMGLYRVVAVGEEPEDWNGYKDGDKF